MEAFSWGGFAAPMSVSEAGTAGRGRWMPSKIKNLICFFLKMGFFACFDKIHVGPVFFCKPFLA